MLYKARIDEMASKNRNKTRSESRKKQRTGTTNHPHTVIDKEQRKMAIYIHKG